jgi:hypothetical protein
MSKTSSSKLLYTFVGGARAGVTDFSTREQDDPHDRQYTESHIRTFIATWITQGTTGSEEILF